VSMPSVHILIAILMAIRSKFQNAKLRFWLPVVSLAGHVVLDLTPHLEPSLFGWNHKDPTSFAFWWTLADIAGASWIMWSATKKYPEHRVLIWLCTIGAFGPDLFDSFGNLLFPKLPAFEAFEAFHMDLHRVWKSRLSQDAQVAVGTVTMLLSWWLVWRLWPRAQTVSSHASRDVRVTEPAEG
jgi:hypothetical protein